MAKIRSKRKGYQVTYNRLLQVATWSLDHVQARDEGWALGVTSAMVFAVFAVEAFANHAGQLLLPDWENIERSLSAVERLRRVMTAAGVPSEAAGPLLESWKEMTTFRHMLAHGRTETVADEHEGPEESVKEFMRGPLTRWDRDATSDNAERYVDTARNIMNAVRERAVELPAAGILGWVTGSHQAIE